MDGKLGFLRAKVTQRMLAPYNEEGEGVVDNTNTHFQRWRQKPKREKREKPAGASSGAKA
jgi:hypothetical protein